MFSTVMPAVKREVPKDTVAAPGENVVLAGLCGVVVMSLVIFIRRNQLRRKALRREVEGGSELSAKELPCGRCQYFSDNPYLPCAVNPGEVLTEEARDCGSFRSIWEEGD